MYSFDQNTEFPNKIQGWIAVSTEEPCLARTLTACLRCDGHTRALLNGGVCQTQIRPRELTGWFGPRRVCTPKERSWTGVSVPEWRVGDCSGSPCPTDPPRWGRNF